SRTWPLERFIQTATLLHQATRWNAIVVGGKKEIQMGVEIEERLSFATSMCGKGKVSQLGRIMERAKLTLCNESGLSHFASFCGSPVQIICGAADPRRTRPMGPGKVEVKVNPVDCWPCEKNQCRQIGEQKIQCLLGSSPEQVMECLQGGI